MNLRLLLFLWCFWGGWCTSEICGQAAVYKAIQQLNTLSKDTLDSNPAQALKYAQSALQSAQNHRHGEGEMLAHINLGNYYQKVGPYDKALYHFEQALYIAEAGKDSTHIVNMWFKIGTNYHNDGNMAEAVRAFAKAFEYHIDDTVNLQKRTKIVKELASQLYNLEEYEKALQYFKMVLKIQEKSKDSKEWGLAYNNVGTTYRMLRRHDEALSYLEQGEKIALRFNESQVLAVISLSKAEVLSDTEKYKEAQEQFQKSLQIAQNQKYTDLTCAIHYEQARMYFKKKDYIASLKYGQKSLKTAQELNWLLGRVQAQKILADAYEAAGNAPKGLKAYKKYTVLRDSLKNEDAERIVRELWVRYETKARIDENVLLKEQSEKNQKLLKETARLNYILLIAIALVIVLVVMLYYSNASVQKNNQRLETRKNELEKSKTELESAYINVELLSEIGRTVMAELSIERITDKLYQRVNLLMDASVFGLALYRAEEHRLYFEGVKENGETLPPFHQDLKERHRHFAVWCFNHNKEVIINDLKNDYAKYDVKVISLTSEDVPSEHISEADDAPQSLIYLPLLNKNKPIGVITVQSFRQNAYSDYQVNILKNLANYVSIALLNAMAYDKITNQKNKIDGQKTQLQWQKSVVDAQNHILGKQKSELDERNLELEIQQKELQKTLNNLQNAQSQLIQSEKLSSLGQLTAGIAHEINNSINFVYAGIDILQEHLKELMQVVEEYDNVTPENYDQKLQQIENLKIELMYEETKNEIFGLVDDIWYGAERTTEIVKGLRTFSRLDEKELKRTNLHHNIEATLIILRNQYKNHIQLVKNFDPYFPEVECFSGKINQVFMNVINNAIQAIEKKGKIEISTRVIKDFELIGDDVERTPLHPPFAEISIQDSGSGIPEKVKNRIFDPFFTTKAVGKGTGLGLHISREIIQKHRGKIIVESKEHEGTTFRIYLPLRQLRKKNPK